jgi:outer membrane lipoprotein-sorting protein
MGSGGRLRERAAILAAAASLAFAGAGRAAAQAVAPGAAAAATASAAAAQPAAQEILRRMDRAMTFDECSMGVVFEDVKASGARRVLGAEVWYASAAGTLVVFGSPAREKGKRILMIGDSMWLGAPGLTKPVRLSGKDAFMGTSFTNDDVMNMDKDDDYEAAVLESGPEGWLLELKARRRELPYQRSRIRVGRDYLPTRQELFLLSGELAKTIEFSEPRAYGAKRRPSTFRVEDAMTRGASTTVRFERISEGAVDRSRLSPSGFMK